MKPDDILDDIRLAGFGRRSLAIIVDFIVLSIISAGLLYGIYGSEYFAWVQENNVMFASYGAAELLVNYGLPTLMFVACWRLFGATPGKFLLGCQVVDSETLARITWRQSVMRYFGYFISTIPLGLGFWWAAWDGRKQGFHDKFAHTIVVVEDESRRTLDDLEKEFPR